MHAKWPKNAAIGGNTNTDSTILKKFVAALLPPPPCLFLWLKPRHSIATLPKYLFSTHIWPVDGGQLIPRRSTRLIQILCTGYPYEISSLILPNFRIISKSYILFIYYVREAAKKVNRNKIGNPTCTPTYSLEPYTSATEQNVGHK